jgi:PD-(D/E)XK nuclease superfamily
LKKNHKIRWSYSQLSTYERCPRAWKFSYLDGAPRRPPGPAASRGTGIHLELETFLGKPRARKVPASLTVLTQAILEAKALGAVGEREIFIDREWRETTEKKAWAVFIIDAHWLVRDTLHVRDLKSGKVRDYADQVRVYLAGLINTYPQVTRGEGGIWYCDQPLSASRRLSVFSRQQIIGLQRELTLRVTKLERDREWKATPGAAACQYCDFSKKFGGPCDKG